MVFVNLTMRKLIVALTALIMTCFLFASFSFLSPKKDNTLKLAELLYYSDFDLGSYFTNSGLRKKIWAYKKVKEMKVSCFSPEGEMTYCAVVLFDKKGNMLKESYCMKDSKYSSSFIYDSFGNKLYELDYKNDTLSKFSNYYAKEKIILKTGPAHKYSSTIDSTFYSYDSLGILVRCETRFTETKNSTITNYYLDTLGLPCLTKVKDKKGEISHWYKFYNEKGVIVKDSTTVPNNASFSGMFSTYSINESNHKTEILHYFIKQPQKLVSKEEYEYNEKGLRAKQVSFSNFKDKLEKTQETFWEYKYYK